MQSGACCVLNDLNETYGQMRLLTNIGYLGHFIQYSDEGLRESGRETALRKEWEGLVNICVCDYLD